MPLTPSPLPETPKPPKPTDVAVAPTPSPLPETPMQTAVAGTEVSGLPQTGALLAESESGPWSKLAIALAAVATLAAGVGAYRLRQREPS